MTHTDPRMSPVSPIFRFFALDLRPTPASTVRTLNRTDRTRFIIHDVQITTEAAAAGHC